MLETPSLIIDEAKLQRNIEKMAQLVSKNGVSLRPHTKTHKIPDIAKMQIAAGATGITVAKVGEAEVMAQHGINDIFIAYPIVTDSKLERVAELSKSINLIIGVDSLEGAFNISEVAKRHNISIQIRLEIDIGFRRTGVLYGDAIKLASELQKMDNIEFQGIYTYRGFFMNGKPTLELEKAGIEEGKLMVDLAERMRSEGIPVRDISVGSTPTAQYAAMVEGITEVRPGTYVFYDRMQAALGCCSLDDCAGSIRATVVSRPSENLMIIDGGSKTFATDVGPNSDPLFLKGFGHIVEAPHAILERLSEEHGMVQISKEDLFKVGDIVHVIPNHICSTVNLHDKIFLKGNDKYEEKIVYARGKLS
ncbi:alanine racemase [Lederbergia wuyishanensis]|uniref:D-serine deaminase-like pyridoxal phosphate-dependent protein n=1 Tax=Lederbergia wuyishanensis TaxID=1347903 RepID=A0ABU0D8C7_9BACI|nr:alanine racemase [Lederbergia wuyishanensis]MCJ8009206.1 alanine racemase [Lederbergia wuyishanensis]MDQ0344664.1 D-serine deaminase-like pyridoxal phosphate-dependent protein [Lederbergia wuyishanensis]